MQQAPFTLQVVIKQKLIFCRSRLHKNCVIAFTGNYSYCALFTRRSRSLRFINPGQCSRCLFRSFFAIWPQKISLTPKQKRLMETQDLETLRLVNLKVTGMSNEAK